MEACEAISEIWEEIGIDTQIQKILYLSIGSQLQARANNQATCHGTDGRLDPFPVILGSAAGWRSGSDHQIQDDLIADALLHTDDEGHFRAMNQAIQFIYENVMETGLYSVNILWTLGLEIESWADDREYGATRAFGSYEFAKPRNW